MKRFFLGLLIVIVFLSILFTAFITTEAGLRSIITIANGLLPGQLGVSTIHGRLIDKVDITGLSYTSPDNNINVGTIKLDWALGALITGKLHINQLLVDNVSITQTSSDEVETKKQASETKIALPLGLYLNDIQLKNINYELNDDKPVIIQSAHLSAFSHNEKLTIKSFTLNSAPNAVSLTGLIQFAEPYQINLTGNIKNNALIEPEFDGQFYAKGDLKNTLKASFASKKPKQLALNLTLKDALNTGLINLNGQWHDLNFAIDSGEYIKSHSGRLSIQGQYHHYLTQFQTDISGNWLPKTQVTLDGSGNLNAFTINHLNGNFFNGTLSAEGKIIWTPNLQWLVNITTKNINPGVIWPDYRASINLTAQSSGSINENNELSTQLTIKQLSGTYLSQKLIGSGSFFYSPNTYAFNTLKLSSGSNHILLNGAINQHSHLVWNINVNNLAHYLPNAKGMIQSSGTLTGKPKDMSIDMRLNAKNIHARQLKIKSIQSKIKLSHNLENYSELFIDAKKLNYGGFKIKNIYTSAKGNLKKHHIYMHLNARNEDFYLDMDGKEENQLFHETIGQLTFKSKKFGAWELDQPIQTSSNLNQINVQPFCWRGDANHYICGKSNWNANQDWQTELNIHHLNLAALNVFLPNTIKLKTDINSQLKINGDGRKSASGILNIMIQNAEAHFISQNEISTIKLTNSSFNTKITDPGLSINSTLHLFNARNTIQFNANVPSYMLSKNINLNQDVRGLLSIKLNDLNTLLKSATPVTQATGSLSGNFELKGKLNNPKLDGKAVLNSPLININSLGLKLRNSLFSLVAKEKNITLSGHLTSGTGKLSLNAQTKLNTIGEKAKMSLKGNNVTVVNNEEYSVNVSPNFVLDYNHPNLTLNGTIDVPYAKITPKDFSSAVTLPSSFIIISPETEAERKVLNFFADINLSLGKNVQVAYSGLKAKLNGKLHIKVKPQAGTTALGKIVVADGKYQAYGSSLNIQQGNLVFTGSSIDNPNLDIIAVKTIPVYNFTSATDGSNKITVGVQVTGDAESPKISLYSIPTLSQTDILSYLLFGKPASGVGGSEAALLGQTASLFAAGQTQGFSNNIEEKLGLSTVGFQSTQVYLPNSSGPQSTTSFVVGKQLTKRLEALYTVGISIPVQILMLRYQVSHHWQLQTQTSSYDNAADIVYTIESG